MFSFGSIIIVVVFLNLCPVITSAEDLFIIGNINVPVSELSPVDIQNIYLGNKKIWGNGIKINVSVIGDGTITDRFLNEYVKKNSITFKCFWKKQVFTGCGKPPAMFENEKDLIDYVSKTKGGVGYVSLRPSSENIKILAVFHEIQN